MADVYDGAWKLFSWDPDIGRSMWVLWEDGKPIIKATYHVDKLMLANANARDQAEGRRFGDISRIASIAPNVYHDSGLAKAHREGDMGFIKRWLNDGNNAKWRVRGGTV